MKASSRWSLFGAVSFWIIAGCSGGGGGGNDGAAGLDGGDAAGGMDAPSDSASAAGTGRGGAGGADAATGAGGSDAAAAGAGGSDAAAGAGGADSGVGGADAAAGAGGSDSGVGGADAAAGAGGSDSGAGDSAAAAGAGGSDAGVGGSDAAAGAGGADAAGGEDARSESRVDAANGAAGSGGSDGGGSGTYKLYVLLDGGSSSASSLEIVDVATWTLIRNVSLGMRYLGDLEVDPSGTQVFVTDAGNIRTIDTTTGADTGGPTLSATYLALALSPDKATLYGLAATGTGTNVLSAFDRTTLTVSDSLSMTDGTSQYPEFALSPDGANIALVWSTTSGPTLLSLRIFDTKPKLSVAGTYPLGVKAATAGNDLRAPAFTDDGRVILHEDAHMYIVPFDVATGAEQPYLDPTPGYNKLPSCVTHCLAYDVGTKKGIAAGNNGDLEGFDLAAEEAGIVGGFSPSGVVRSTLASPGGGTFADVKHAAATADTLTNASGTTVYTFSQAKPVVAMRIARTP